MVHCTADGMGWDGMGRGGGDNTEVPHALLVITLIPEGKLGDLMHARVCTGAREI